jgi:hypothetical protein
MESIPESIKEIIAQKVEITSTKPMRYGAHPLQALSQVSRSWYKVARSSLQTLRVSGLRLQERPSSASTLLALFPSVVSLTLEPKSSEDLDEFASNMGNVSNHLQALDIEFGLTDEETQEAAYVLHSSIAAIPALTSLKINAAHTLWALPNISPSWKRLQVLDLKYCPRLQRLPTHTAANWECLTELSLTHSLQLSTLPPEIGNCTKLQRVNLSHCASLESLPSEVGRWSNLKLFVAEYCTSLQQLPESAALWTQLANLNIFQCRSFASLPHNGRTFRMLRALNLGGSRANENLSKIAASNWDLLSALEISANPHVTKLEKSQLLCATPLTSLNLAWCTNLMEIDPNVAD